MRISAISTPQPNPGQATVEILGLKSPKLIKELKRLVQNVLEDKKIKKIGRFKNPKINLQSSNLEIFKSNRLISIIFVNNEYIRRLNRKYLKRDRITDVLAFPFENDFFGEVYVCRPRAKKQAQEYGSTEREEIFRLVNHGVMHLLGYHHKD